MKLVIKRNQDEGLFGGISFVLNAQVVLTSEEDALVRRYKVHKEILFNDGKKEYTINHLVSGVREKCKDVKVLLAAEDTVKNAAESFHTLLRIMASFGGEEILEYSLAEGRIEQ